MGYNKENLCTKYFPFTYKYITLNEKPPVMKENLCIFFYYRQSWVYQSSFVAGSVYYTSSEHYIQAKGAELFDDAQVVKGHSLPTACCPGGGIRMVGNPMQPLWVVSLGLTMQHCLTWHTGFLGYQTRRNPGTGPSAAVLCREFMMPPGDLCNAAQDLQRCMVPLMHLEGVEIVEASQLGLADDRPQMSPTLAEEAVLLGDEPEPQEATTFLCKSPE